MLTAKYLKGIPEGSRATQGKSLRQRVPERRAPSRTSARSTRSPSARGQTLAQMAIAWVLRDGGITSALIGASRPSQVEDCVGAVENLDFTADGAGRDRPLRRRGEHQPLGALLGDRLRPATIAGA